MYIYCTKNISLQYNPEINPFKKQEPRLLHGTLPRGKFNIISYGESYAFLSQSELFMNRFFACLQFAVSDSVPNCCGDLRSKQVTHDAEAKQ